MNLVGMKPCPICGKPVADNAPNMPFCSERCQLLDLGAWASEKYVIPGGTRLTELVEEDGDEADEEHGVV